MHSAKLPQKQNLALETARAIQERICDEEWGNALPSERKLVELLEVGRDTVRKALAHLTHQGWISAPKENQKRLILKKTKLADSPLKRKQTKFVFTVGLLSPVPIDKMHSSILYEIHKLEEALATRSGQLHVVTGTWVNQDSSFKKLEEVLTHPTCSLWILYRCPTQIQEYFAQNKIPCLVRGQSYNPEKLPQLDTDWRAIANHAAALLWRKGHKNVALILRDENLQGVKAVEQGFLEFKEEDWHPHIIWDRNNAEQLAKDLSNFKKFHPEVTAFICSRPRHILTFYSWVSQQGFCVPGDISLVSLCYEYFFNEFSPKLCYYQYNPQQIARRMVKSIMNVLASKKLTLTAEWIIPKYEAGGTIKTLQK